MFAIRNSRGYPAFPIRFTGILLVGLMLSACQYGGACPTPTPTPDTDLLTRWLNAEPCAPPCWEGIVPGTTSTTEAIALLEANPFITNIQRYDDGRKGGVSWESSPYWAASNRGSFSFDPTDPGQIVHHVNVQFPFLCLGNIIQSHGDPSHVLIYADRSSINHGVFGAGIVVYWLPQNFSMQVEGSSKPQINEYLCGASVTFFAPSTTLDNPPIANYVDYLLPWDGYGDFDKYFLPEQLPDWFEYP